MEERGDSIELGRNNFVNCIRYVKIALALSIVYNRPGNLLPVQYAEQLHEELGKPEDLIWKEKVKKLQAEVLQLRQSLLLSREEANIITSRTSIRNQNGTLSQIILTPPPSLSSQALNNARTDIAAESELQQDCNFFICFVTLKTASRQLFRAGQRNPQDGICGKAIETSIRRVIQRLRSWFFEKPDSEIPGNLLLQVLEVIVTLADNKVSPELESELVEFIEDSLKNIYVTDTLKHPMRQTDACEVVAQLGRSQVLFPRIFTACLGHITEHSELLRSDPTRMENIWHLFDLLRDVLEHWSTTSDGKRLSTVTMDDFSSWRSKLDDCFIAVLNRNKLFASVVWQTMFLLNAVVVRMQG